MTLLRGVIWAGLDKTIPEKYIKDSIAIWQGNDMKPYILGGTIGTHVGPGAIGLAFFKK